MMILQGKGP